MSESESTWLERARAFDPPSHVGIIMDGNGRWAKRKGLPRHEGHKAGVESVKRCLPAAQELGIKYLSLFVFSSENWRRPSTEVHYLFDLLLAWAAKDVKELTQRGIRIVPLGRWNDLPAPVSRALASVARETAENSDLTVAILVNYGGRQEIIDAVRVVARELSKSPRRLEELDEELFRKYLYAPDIPDPDLIIRTSGEMRLSNFWLWGSAYAELVFSDVLWPDFCPIDLYKAIADYGERERRFGGVSERKG